MPFALFNFLAFVVPLTTAILTGVAIGSWRTAPRGLLVVWLLVCAFAIAASALGGLLANWARDQFSPMRSNPTQATIMILIMIAVEVLVSWVLRARCARKTA